MRVLLVRPRRLNAMTVFGGILCEPLELETLLPACRAAGAEAQIYDGVVERRPFSAVVGAFRPHVVAVTGYLNQEREMRAYLRLARRVCPDCRTVAGGVHAQLNHGRLYWPEVDFVYRSESADAFRRLLEAVGRGETPEDIPGLCRRAGEAWVETPYAPADLDGLPLPDRSGWPPEAGRYLDFPGLATLKTACSCPYRCDFCYGRNLHGGVYQARRLDLVLDELEGIAQEHVFLVDSDFLLDEGRVRVFLAGLAAREIRKQFLCYARADFLAEHADLVKELCRAGFRLFLVGFEGIRDQRLGAWNKGTSRAANEACLEAVRAAGGECVGLLLADPDFRRGDFGALYRWVRDQGLRYASVQVLTPIPPTPFYQREKGRLLSADLRKWDLTHLLLPPEHMGRAEFLARYWFLMARLALLGRGRGAFRFVTPRYLAGVLGNWIGRARALR